MQAEECREAFKRLFPSREAAARFFGKDERTVRRWQAGDWPVPASVAKLTAVMIRLDLTPERVDDEWMREMGL